MKKTKNLINNLHNIYFIIMSCCILCLFFFFRLIMKRSGYLLNILKESVDIYYFCFCLALTLMHLFIIAITFYSFISIKTHENKYIIYLKKISEILLWKPLTYFLKTISPHIPYSGTLIILYCEFFKKNLFRISLMKSLTIIFYFFPRILMSIIFLTELLFLNRLQVFITCFWLLIIPFIYIFFINLCEHFFSNNINDILEGLLVEPTGVPNKHGVYTAHYFSIKNNSGFSKEDLPSLIDNWTLLFYLDNLNKITRNFINKYAPYITIFTSLCYIVSFSYKIYYLFIL